MSTAHIKNIEDGSKNNKKITFVSIQRLLIILSKSIGIVEYRK